MEIQQKKNKLAVIVPYWKRPEITKLCFEWLSNQSERLDFDVYVSGDNKEIVPGNFTFVEAKNYPLGSKLNTMLKKTKGYDVVSVIDRDWETSKSNLSD